IPLRGSLTMRKLGLEVPFCMDMVYSVPGQRNPTLTHSAMTLLTAGLLAGLARRFSGRPHASQ
ncbi:MAG: hypothetical protein ACE5HB_04085, partial [Terriglobia bacterium]